MQLFYYGVKYLIVSNTADIISLIGSGEGRRKKDKKDLRRPKLKKGVNIREAVGRVNKGLLMAAASLASNQQGLPIQLQRGK